MTGKGRMHMERILLFGTGLFYLYRKGSLAACLGDDEVVGFIDNHPPEGKAFEGKPVYLPQELQHAAYDRILLMSFGVREMAEQLLGLGVERSKISFYRAYRARKTRGKFELPVLPQARTKKEVLMISDDLRYEGSSTVLVYGAKVLQARGCQVTIAAPSVLPQLEAELARDGIRVVHVPTLPYVSDAEARWMRQYDALLVNRIVNLHVARVMRDMHPLLWVHAPGAPYTRRYEGVQYEFPEDGTREALAGVRVFGVSRLAAANVMRYYPDVPAGVLPYGVPDAWDGRVTVHDHPVFALIGYFHATKGQQAFLEAVRLLQARGAGKDAEFWLIGAQNPSAYGHAVRAMAEAMPAVRCKGVLTHEEMAEAYRRIDVVVSASPVEMLSTVCVECLMHADVCLLTRQNGVAPYLTNGVDGFVCEDNEPAHLAAAMERVLDARARWAEIGRNGRAVYEQHFSLDRFGDRLARELGLDGR